jgi:hypothetical protein
MQRQQELCVDFVFSPLKHMGYLVSTLVLNFIQYIHVVEAHTLSCEKNKSYFYRSKDIFID